MIPMLTKRAAEERTFEVNVGPAMRLEDTIRTVDSVAADGVTIDDVSHTAAIIRFQAAGGSPGASYTLRLRWTTEQNPEQMLEALVHLVIAVEDVAGDTLRDNFRMQFPEFDRTAGAAVDLALAEARLINDRRELVTLYLAAHILTTAAQVAAGNTGVTGAVVSDRVGPLQSQYGSLTQDGDIRAELARTAYGARALLLESRSAASRIGATVAG